MAHEIFHEVWGVAAVAGEAIERRTSSAQTSQLFDRYFMPAGVSKKWLARLRRRIAGGNDYWQTGRDLWESKSGVITDPIENLRRREQRMYFMPVVVCGEFCRG
ncbi:MAG TPA: hypothetical protein VIG52_06705 [Methyloceanibacter sp.]|jgi:hypothetical protein